MIRKFLAFDVETAKQLPGDFSEWRKHRPLGICCAATVAPVNHQHRLWQPTQRVRRERQAADASDGRALVIFSRRVVGGGSRR
jgi:hypothetical protein